ncbi:developmental pluripotency-associated protein 3-like [Artibeus jamaicensis]|uniref:developmental pluripotency-associated protein 3-like n=1 Tax=Artibeus jamaicensis TaxID=9417 RepID=UPI00235B2199|nr:developmental pluripotency-associated protein 3-like [Artibeus jamaicensis]
MDSPTFNPTWNMESTQVPAEGNSADAQAVSELLAKNLGNLTLNPDIKLSPLPPESSPKKQEKGKSLQSLGLGLGLGEGLLLEKRHGVRTVASVRKERMQRALQVIRFCTLSLLKKTPEERKLEIEARTRKFRCSCLYCLHYGDLSDYIEMKNSYDMGLV